MSSHVVVIDSTARRAVVKVTPVKHLSDVLGEACSKLGLDARHYGLKHQKKQIDLSLSFRLSGLSSGAKLELVQLSRSPAVVSVALQLPESEAHGIPNGRLVDKFPSNTTLWLILRKFESGVAGNAPERNLTARGAPAISGGGTPGEGRLYYQTPVAQMMGRELSSFTDLQKTLGQLGFNGGSALIRLSFRTTDRPLEEAMAEIDAYFKSMDADQPTTGGPQDTTPAPVSSTPSEDTSQSTPVLIPSNLESSSEAAAAPEPEPEITSPPPPSTVVSSRQATVYAPPSSATPQSAQTPFNETDYLPTVDHAKLHQQRLNLYSRPSRLASDAELATKEAALQAKVASVAEVEVKIRFPDQSQVVAKFNKEDTPQALYEFVRSCLDRPFSNEKFFLSYFANAVPGTPASNTQTVIPDCIDKFLIRDLRMSGRVLVNFSWDAKAALAARGAGSQLLRPELREKASQIKVQTIAPEAPEETEHERRSFLDRMRPGGGDENRSGSRKGGGVPKWLKLPGKK
ncbi:hypothetical protein AJ80_05403 [Polytolypa hystricis UAMH7299]|uniref:UBX domain-containing protein n=1 Tax=Polytolypa hystricis (strain UAMH7299) TaxID=1447883 RepID=A0A2B7Y4U9_POLH7|nr:hypothetical protein AJ80_05403 [Polytolypa hystricis UAMH7299]